MAKWRLIFAVLFVVLLFTSVFLYISNSSKQADLEEAKRLGLAVEDYLDQIELRCRARADDYGQLANCMKGLSKQITSLGEMGEADFKDYEPETNTSGYLILSNEGRSSLNSSQFVLLKNREVVDEGCAIQGAIDPGYTCKLFFNSICERGDVLEVKYNDTRAFLKTC